MNYYGGRGVYRRVNVSVLCVYRATLGNTSGRENIPVKVFGSTAVHRADCRIGEQRTCQPFVTESNVTSSLGHGPTTARPTSELKDSPAGQPGTQPMLLSVGTYGLGSPKPPTMRAVEISRVWNQGPPSSQIPTNHGWRPGGLRLSRAQKGLTARCFQTSTAEAVSRNHSD